MKKDPELVEKFTKAISEKFGPETVQDPRVNWTPAKEREYRKEVKEIQKRHDEYRDDLDKVEVNGVLIPNKLFTKESSRTCATCELYSFEGKDDLYMTKFGCCFNCYIQHIEGREDKWLNHQTEQDLKKSSEKNSPT